MAIKFGRPIESRGRWTPLEPGPVVGSEHLALPLRMRRNRRAEWARRMVREHVLTTDDGLEFGLIKGKVALDLGRNEQELVIELGQAKLLLNVVGKHANVA